MQQESKKNEPSRYVPPAWLKYLYFKVIAVFAVGFFIVDDRETWKYVFWALCGVVVLLELIDFWRFWWRRRPSS